MCQVLLLTVAQARLVPTKSGETRNRPMTVRVTLGQDFELQKSESELRYRPGVCHFLYHGRADARTRTVLECQAPRRRRDHPNNLGGVVRIYRWPLAGENRDESPPTPVYFRLLLASTMDETKPTTNFDGPVEPAFPTGSGHITGYRPVPSVTASASASVP